MMMMFTVALYALLWHNVLPDIKPLWISQKIVKTIHQQTPTSITATKPLLAVSYQEPSLVFLLGTKKVKYTDQASLPQQIKSGQFALVDVTTINLDDYRIIAEFYGFNYVFGKWTRFALVAYK